MSKKGENEMTQVLEQMKQMQKQMLSMQEQIVNMQTDKQQENKNTSSKEKTERKVSHAYQEKGEILMNTKPKTLAKYITKDNMKTPKSTKKNPNPNPFPINRAIALNLFKDFEIAGKPWIAYREQLDLMEKMMKHYKYTKASKIKKYNECLDYIKHRQEAVEKEKGSKGIKKNKMQSLIVVEKAINNKLESLL